MTISSILSFIAPFADMAKPEILNLESQGMAELNTIIANTSSPDLKLALQTFATALDAFAKAEISKL